ncbi:hypothetical protein [Kingella kingae]|uniref:hypothetical protein n=1 Tax=Kingella kingae TaxID=504 RepID=UPI001E2C8C26|nr:hypothetical protein [Kingella kingae]
MPVTTILPENGSPKLDWTFTPPIPATALNDVIKDKDAAIILLLVFTFTLHNSLASIGLFSTTCDTINRFS